MFATIVLQPGGIVAWVVVGLLAGWLASHVMGSGYGLVGDLVLGLLGAVIGGFIVGGLTTGTYGLAGSVGVAFIGGVIVVAASRLVARGHAGARI